MNYASPEKLSQLRVTDRHRKQALLSKMEALKEKLDNFTVLDRHGKAMGDVRNLVFSQQQLYLVVVQPDAHRYWRFVLLNSHLVQRVSLLDQSVFVSTTLADMSYLPEYQATPLSANSSDANAPTKLLASVRQLPAPLRTDRIHRLELAGATFPEWLTAQNVLPLHTHTHEPQRLDAPAMPKVLASPIDRSTPQPSEAQPLPKYEAKAAQAV